VHVHDLPVGQTMTELISAVIAFLFGWKLAASSGSTSSTPASAAKSAVSKVVTQASSTVLSVVWDVAWHVMLIVAVLAILACGGRWLLRRGRRDLLGR
jgi:hypothetical protein